MRVSMCLHACLSIALCKCGGAVDVCCQAWCWLLWILPTDASLDTEASIDGNKKDKVDILHIEEKGRQKEQQHPA